MKRPMALLRRLLIAEEIQAHVSREITNIKAQMKAEELKIIDRKDNQDDVWIQYQCDNEYDEAVFMRKMLDAESSSRAKRTGILS